MQDCKNSSSMQDCKECIASCKIVKRVLVANILFQLLLLHLHMYICTYVMPCRLSLFSVKLSPYSVKFFKIFTSPLPPPRLFPTNAEDKHFGFITVHIRGLTPTISCDKKYICSWVKSILLIFTVLNPIIVVNQFFSYTKLMLVQSTIHTIFFLRICFVVYLEANLL